MSSDTMEAILNDCTVSPEEYCRKHGCGQGVCDELADCVPDMCTHLVGRAVAATRHGRACPRHDAGARRRNIHDEGPMTGRGLRDDGQLAFLCGWLDGFSGTLLALLSNQKRPEVVAEETCDIYDARVAELRGLLGVGDE